MASQDRASHDSPEEVRVGWQMAGLGFQASSEVIAGAALGWLWDRWRGTGPTGVLVGSLIGLAVGLFTLVRRSLLLNRRLDEMARRRRADHEPASSKPTAETGPESEDEDDEEDDDWDRRWNEKWGHEQPPDDTER